MNNALSYTAVCTLHSPLWRSGTRSRCHSSGQRTHTGQWPHAGDCPHTGHTPDGQLPATPARSPLKYTQSGRIDIVSQGALILSARLHSYCQSDIDIPQRNSVVVRVHTTIFMLLFVYTQLYLSSCLHFITVIQLKSITLVFFVFHVYMCSKLQFHSC